MTENLPEILFGLMLVTGALWLLDTLYLGRLRSARAASSLAEFDARLDRLSDEARGQQSKYRDEIAQKAGRKPLWVEYSADFFPVIAFVFLMRSFLFEPFTIPSSSMVPTLLVGDYILVNKYIYGVRLPLIDQKIISISEPQRGEVMVFRYPVDPSQHYIKRVIGTPGDVVEYRDKRLTINGEALAYKAEEDFYEQPGQRSLRATETLNGVAHAVLQSPDDASPVRLGDFPGREYCSAIGDGFRCKVPAGRYFMMGDNRDNSADSRVWGFVPEENIVGRAIAVWMNFSDLTHLGSIR